MAVQIETMMGEINIITCRNLHWRISMVSSRNSMTFPQSRHMMIVMLLTIEFKDGFATLEMVTHHNASIVELIENAIDSKANLFALINELL